MTFPAILRTILLSCFAPLVLIPAFSQSVTVSPTSVSFGNQAQGTSSSIHKVTLRNGQTSAITISSISTNLADYSETNTCPVSPATLPRSSTCTISVTFTPTAQGSRSATLTVVDSGLSSPQMVTLTGTGTAPVLKSIAVTPGTASLIAGSTQQFTATGTYSDGSTQNLTTTANWTSSSTSIATIGVHTGLAKGVAPGTVTVTATSSKISGTATLTVSAAVLTSIAVTPAAPSLAVGKTQQFTATGTYNNGTTKNLTGTATWTSSATSIATIIGSGLATTIAPGSATITATSGTISGSATLTVTAVTLVSISVSPQSPIISLTMTEQFAATGTYSDGSTQTITSSVTWTSDTQSVATISNSAGSQGLATSVGVGTATISASEGSISASTELTVVLQAATQTWTLHGPSGRRSHTTVYDPVSQQMIIFGGQEAVTNTNLNDVWLGTTSTTQNDSFFAESPSGSAPPARYGHVATYDSNSNRMTIFGGNLGASSCANDVWILSGANGQSGTPAWINATPSGVLPSARVSSNGVYDPNTNSLIVFGGYSCNSNYFNDVWVLSNANGLAGTSTWTQLVPSGSAPAARESSTAVYDATTNILMVYGGDAGGSPFSDVWALSNANGTGGTPVWTQLLPTGTAPASRTGHTAIFDSVNDRMTIFGGAGANGVTFSDAWVLTTANGVGGTPAWIEIPAQGTAPSLAYHTAVYDSAKDNMYVFAGMSSQDKLQANNHAFTLNAANGIPSTGQKWTLGGPPVRYSQSAFYDPSTNGLFVFGGQHASTNLNFGDYWMESPVIGSLNLQWTVITTKGSKPSARFGHTGLYDSGSDRMMIFAGATGFPSPCVNDYYVLEQANAQNGTWLSISPSGTPPPVRTHHSSVYDSSTNTMIVFGGYNCASTYYNDVWILTNANDMTGQPSWIQLDPAGGPPSARESSSAVYDPTTNSLIVYGGDSGGQPMGDIWILSNANGSSGTPVWTQMSPSNSGPVARSGHTATYDSQNNVMTIYGGYNGTSVLGDTWVLSGANGQGGSATWTQLPAGPLRRFHSAEYDPISDQMITYGGASGIAPQTPSSDVYTMTDANNVP